MSMFHELAISIEATVRHFYNTQKNDGLSSISCRLRVLVLAPWQKNASLSFLIACQAADLVNIVNLLLQYLFISKILFIFLLLKLL